MRVRCTFSGRQLWHQKQDVLRHGLIHPGGRQDRIDGVLGLIPHLPLTVPIVSLPPPVGDRSGIGGLSLGDLHVDDTRFFERAGKQVDGRPCSFNTGCMVAATIYQCCPTGSRCTVHRGGMPYCKRLLAGETSADRDSCHNFKGQIRFLDGTTASYILLWDDLGGDQIAWAQNPDDLNGGVSKLRFIPSSRIVQNRL